MTTLIVDTNIVFSVLLTDNSAIGDFIFRAAVEYDIKLIAPEYIRVELSNHFQRAVRLTGLSEAICELRQNAILNQIEIIKESLIPVPQFAEAARLVRDVDIDDVAFVATTLHYQGSLLTGDRKLYRGLLAKGFTDVVSFSDLTLELDIDESI